MINSEYVEMLEHKDIIFELAAYANQRRAEVGPENVFDFSLGGPSVPPPIEVHQALQELIEEGEYPNDVELVGSIVKDICYNNAIRYFSK